MSNRPLFEIDKSVFPWSCLPYGIDASNFIDITAIGDGWRKYMDTSTGRIHDGEEYAKLMNNEFAVQPHNKEQ